MVVTNYVWDVVNDSYLMETDENDVTQMVYTNRPDMYGELISQRRNTGGSWSVEYYHFDGLGSTANISDINETVPETYIYDAFGNVLSSNSFTPNFLWVGQLGYYWDSLLAEYYIRARHYDPAIARWLSQDPIGFEGGEENLYRYGGNEPVLIIDPSGLAWIDLCPHKCSPLNAQRKVTVDDIQLKNRLSPSPPGRVSGLSLKTKALALILKKLATKLPGGNLPGAKQLLKQLAKMATLAVNNANGLEQSMQTNNGVTIWLKVSGECCDNEKCCFRWTRRDWQDKEYWEHCKESSSIGSLEFPGFKFDDAAGIGAAVPKCVVSALTGFTCP